MSFKIPDKFSKFLKSLLAKDKLLIIFLAGILLIIINLPVGDTKEKKVTDTVAQTDLNQSLYEEKYIEYLEERLEKVLSESASIGKATVMITAANRGTNILYNQTSETSSKTTETDGSGSVITEEISKDRVVIFTEEDGSQIPFVVSELMPEIQGVIITAEGAGNAAVVSEITEAASAVLGIEVNKIKVLKMEG